MAYAPLNRIEVDVVNVGQGMCNVVHGYTTDVSGIEGLSFLMLCDCGGSSYPCVNNEMQELIQLMKKRADYENKHQQIDEYDKTFKIEGESEYKKCTHFIDIFSLSHPDSDHYNLLYNIAYPTKNMIKESHSRRTRSLLTKNHPIFQDKPLPLHLSGYECIDYVYMYSDLNTITSIESSFSQSYSFVSDNITYDIEYNYRFISQKIESRMLSINTSNADDSFYVDYSIKLVPNGYGFCDFGFDISYSTGSVGLTMQLFINDRGEKNWNIRLNKYNNENVLLLPSIIILSTQLDVNIIMQQLRDNIKELFERYKIPFDTFPDDNLKDFLAKTQIIEWLCFSIDHDYIEKKLDGKILDTKNIEYSNVLTEITPLNNDDIFGIYHFYYNSNHKLNTKIQCLVNKSILTVPLSCGCPTPAKNAPPEIKITSITPPDDFSRIPHFFGASSDDLTNLFSVTTIVKYKKQKFIFPGDPKAKTMFWQFSDSTIKELIKIPLLLCAPHHGSWETAKGEYTDSTGTRKWILKTYLETIKPQVHIASISFKNKYNHPRSEYIIIAKCELSPTDIENANQNHMLYYQNKSKVSYFVNTNLNLYTTVSYSFSGKIGDTVVTIDKNILKFCHYSFSVTAAGVATFEIIKLRNPIALPNAPKLSLTPSDFTFDHSGDALWI